MASNTSLSTQNDTQGYISLVVGIVAAALIAIAVWP